MLSVLSRTKRFSVFEATDNAVIAGTMNIIMKSGWVTTKDLGYPWTGIDLTDSGRAALARAKGAA